jgi:hypothetical protein
LRERRGGARGGNEDEGDPADLHAASLHRTLILAEAAVSNGSRFWSTM